MGSETSKLPDLEIEERNVEVTADWTMHRAHVYSEKPYSVSLFVFEPSNDVNVKKTVLLERCAKNLLKYRHPCILKYISSYWSKGSFYLATEVAKPLTHVLQSQSPLQICVGLHSILKAINFLHRKAQASHNNLCRAAVYVSPDGVWKLGGFEHMCPFSKLSHAFLQKASDSRYQKAIAPEEESPESLLSLPTSIDQFAFGVLVEEVLNCESEDEVPALKEFLELAKTQLQNVRHTSRPTLSTLLTHDFFSHDFIRVYSFLVELPVKTEEEKKSFFSCLVDQLLTFPETLVAKQLSGLLLARLVLLDSAAQECLLPHILHPRSENGGNGLLSPNMYRQYIVPQLVQIFCVRDAQIRLVLLKHFKHYFHMFTLEQLKNQILPELLVGIKDTNDLLVTATLCALAELVPVLGAAAVIGGKRARLFTDGRPLVVGHQSRATQLQCDPNGITSCDVQLSERPSPDGGEDHSSSDEETAVWSDWENNGESNVPDSVLEEKPKPSTRHQEKPSQTLHDISFLDIKSAPTSSQDEFNYFQDMEPVISKPPVAQIDQDIEHGVQTHGITSRLFAVDTSEHDKWLAESDGWGDDIVDWDNNESHKDDLENTIVT
ncbi:protein-associating with the carboxyl-terminal domain of ezrin [Schistocerca nitens]|uniref:protein-associating with the carboxyl-terminal domain of ezrin n=1 Tax=Schistocerca nitens TaxID=7011 RepID=UPI0021173D47|nr:protein-associating with the carboxyl-terminal domain of ezrin [Schistocerca nitens]XP_049806644.1 protein-associating with the carboxyl-terminal domain of ezrin [Schistocerca nitens]XP_049806645.1 protein-associating with the carboxyl-terminal domain of ezrin [Schistocerca nitens]